MVLIVRRLWGVEVFWDHLCAVRISDGFFIWLKTNQTNYTAQLSNVIFSSLIVEEFWPTSSLFVNFSRTYETVRVTLNDSTSATSNSNCKYAFFAIKSNSRGSASNWCLILKRILNIVILRVLGNLLYSLSISRRRSSKSDSWSWSEPSVPIAYAFQLSFLLSHFP